MELLLTALYVTNQGNNNVEVIDVASNEVILVE
ncbi:hypothetical protein [Bacillus thuringiensis]